MEFRQLQYMLVVAEEKSFTKAAQKLYIAQPSLSQYIQRLEDQLGIKLFDRTTSPLTLTYAGEIFVENARRILDLRYQLESQMQEIIDFKKGRLTVGITNTRSSIVLSRILPIFRKKFPGIEFRFEEGTLSELEDFAIKGITDISIVTSPLNTPQFIYEPLLTENIILLVPPTHKLSKISRNRPPWSQIHLADLREEPFILLKPGRSLRKIADQCFLHAGFQPQIAFECPNPETIVSLVKAGMGFSFGTDILAKFGDFPEKLTFCSLDDQPPPRTLAIAYLKERYLSRAALEFIALSKEVLTPKIVDQI